MKSSRSLFVKTPTKIPADTTIFNSITGGGLPHGRTTLLPGTVRTANAIPGAESQNPIEA